MTEATGRREPLPVVVLTGFLGSGKTSLLKRILAHEAAGRSAVLINEFGEVGLDHLIVSEVAPDVVLLKSGCVCCSVRGELRDALAALLSQRERGLVPPFERIILETTGLADPGPILGTLLADTVLRYHTRLAQVVCVVDACLAPEEQHPEWFAQVGAADTLVISKADLATAAQQASTRGRLRQLNPAARVLDVADALRGGDELLSGEVGDARRPDLARLVSQAEHHHHTGGVTSCCLTFEHQLEWVRFGLWLTLLLSAHGSRLLRVKGLLNVSGHTGPVVVHGVQHLIHPPEQLEAWPSDDRRSTVLFIFTGLEAADLERSFRVFTGARATVRA